MKYLKILFFSFLIIVFSSCDSIDIAKKDMNNYEIFKIKSENKRLFHGFVKAQHIIDLSFQSEGRIVYFPVTIGDYIKKGQVVARLDGILYEIQKREELARLNEAKIRQKRYDTYFKRVDMLHKAGAISDNDWEEAYFNLKTASQDVVIQKEKISYIDKQISYNELTAPYDGYVYEKKSDVGAQATIAQPVLSMITSDKTEVDTMVDSSIINDLKTGQIVKVFRNNKIFNGKIAHISKSSLGSGGYLIRIFLNELDLNLKEGMSVDVEFQVNSLKIFVPLKFVLFDDKKNEKYVFRIKREKENKAQIQKVFVTTGNLINDYVEIKQGLNKNDEIIIQPNSNKLKDKKIINL